MLITGLFAGAACVLLLTLAPIGLPFQMTLFAIGVFLYSIRPVIFAAAFDVTPRGLGGSLVGPPALLRFYVLHCIFIPLVAGALMIVHFWRIRKDGGISGPL